MDKKNRLAVYFVTQITKKSGNIEARVNRALNAIDHLLEKGWTLQEIKEELDLFAQTYPQIVTNVYHMEEIMGTKEPPNNLMEKDVFYYHNKLREVPEAPRLMYNKEKRLYERVEAPFYLVMKTRFTMQDLLKYWYESNGMEPNEHNIKQDKGRFEYLLEFYDLDEILFMIDVAQADRKDKNLRLVRNVFELEKYIEEAREAIKQKKNAHKLQGIDDIIPKERQYQQ